MLTYDGDAVYDDFAFAYDGAAVAAPQEYLGTRLDFVHLRAGGVPFVHARPAALIFPSDGGG